MTTTDLIIASDTALTPFVDAMILSAEKALGLSEGEKLDTGHSPTGFPSEYVIHDFPAEVRR